MSDASADVRRGVAASDALDRPSLAGEGLGRFVIGSIVGVILVRRLPALELWPLALSAVQLGGPALVLVVRRRERPSLVAKVGALTLALAAGSVAVMSGTPPTFAAGGIVAALVAIQTADRDLWIRVASLLAAYGVMLGVPVAAGRGVTFFSAGDDDLATTVGDVSRLSALVAGLLLLNFVILREERERERELAAVAAERARIARELHDVIAHQVTLGLVQAEVARATLPDGATESALALDRVTESSRRAMTELRSLLGVLRDPDGTQERAPQPGVDALQALIAGGREASLDVDLTVDPRAGALAEGVQTSIYRLVQEALTNVVRHVGPTEVRIAVRCDDEIEVSVVDAGPRNGSRPVPSAGGGGHGLAGMRERVTSLGGTLQAEPEGRGFAVRATIPLPS